MHRFTSQAGVEDTLRGPDLASGPGSRGGRRYRPSGPLRLPDHLARRRNSGTS